MADCRLIPKESAAKYLKMNRTQLDKMVALGIIEARNWGKGVHFDIVDLDAFIDNVFSPEFPENFKNPKHRKFLEDKFLTFENKVDIKMRDLAI